MKTLKFLIIALLVTFSFASAGAKAKVAIVHPVQHRVVVIRKPVRHHRIVVVKKVVRHRYRRPVRHY